ncbi:hypothetical protein LIPSTDRAFT_226668 [Lipomyces starkeyi NRRL Y-11557]|uniref:Uncharacterized protein n=1 Tax=Lipomyces starkeyi NRRL Y-11557 TaxID=675824 RepID=A0A1E3QAE6_LIPST|nr:hypothetical protein LIPSTDRAFT_226668 [Lipomyces starkeyi NRRL Y-11557]
MIILKHTQNKNYMNYRFLRPLYILGTLSSGTSRHSTNTQLRHRCTLLEYSTIYDRRCWAMTAGIRERKVSTLSTKTLVDSMGDDLGDLVISLLLMC